MEHDKIQNNGNDATMSQQSLREQILSLYKDPAYQHLKAYYEQSTAFSILGVERSENRHSSFWAWLLNPKSSHSLSEMPLRRFLALAASKAETDEMCKSALVREHLISGDYSLQVLDFGKERSIAALAGGDTKAVDSILEKTENGAISTSSQNRFDVWMLLNLCFSEVEDVVERWTIPVVIENKIYSKEGITNKQYQTVRYETAIKALQSQFCDNDNYQPIFVYLSPDEAKGPESNAFIHLLYQDLLNHILQPSLVLMSHMNGNTEIESMIKGYIRNLSTPSLNDSGEKKEYSIMAISNDESSNLAHVFDSLAFRTVLSSLYEKEAKVLLGASFIQYSEDVLSLPEQFWNANEPLFKVVLYNQFRNEKEKIKTALSIIKKNNRDNSRYMVKDPVTSEWLNKKPASKSEASYLITKAYCILQHKNNPNREISIDDLRKAFPGQLNNYYHSRFFQYLFYNIDEALFYDVVGSKAYKKIVDINNAWDFYLDDNHKLPYVKGNIRNVKMWRKQDFDQLLLKAKEHSIVVERIE